MFRLKILKYLAQGQITHNVILLQNVAKLNYAFGHQCTKCISNIKLAETLKPETHSKNVLNKEQNRTTGNKDSTDKEYLVYLKNDPDQFGPPQEKEIVDEGDLREEKYFTEQPMPSQKLRTKQYADIIKELINQRKIKEAIDVVEVRMLQEDRVKPENYIYNLLLGACGRVGYTKKAFMLYNLMKKRGLKITGGTYTALFNACANSPWPTTDGLTRASHLRNIMIEKGYEPNDTNYNAMIKAFGRCGDVHTAFTLVDEMCSKGFEIKDDNINFLLQACISDKEAGFRHALLVWKKLVDRNIPPSIYTYNLMLRCIRECGLGDIEIMEDLINKLVPNNTQLLRQGTTENSGQNLLLSNIESNCDEGNSKHSSKNENINFSNVDESYLSDRNVAHEADILVAVDGQAKVTDTRPNLMAPVPHLGSLISLSEVTKPEERLLLVGGCMGFLESMTEHQCTPNIKTFTQLLDNIPSTLASEKELLSVMKKFKIKPDIDFYNMLIKKRSMRFDFENAREVLEYMKQQKYQPNIITYGVLALSCKNKEEALELIAEMESKSYRLNIQILGAMLYQACYHMNFDYVMELMAICLRENIQPSKRFMNILEEFMNKCKKLRNSKKLPESQEKSFRILRGKYKDWVQEVQVDDTEDVHPWQQYRQTNSQDTMAQYKWKDGARFKPRHNSRFRVKTSPKHKK